MAETETETQSLLHSFFPDHVHVRTEYLESSLDATRRQTRRFLGSKTGHYSVLLLVGLDVSCIFADFVIKILTCEGKIRKDDGDAALDALSIVSLVFSCLFMAELLASLWAFGLKYFHSKFRCFDALVIIISFVTDTLLHGSLEEVASLIIILRLWRVFKIIEELGVGAQEQMEAIQTRLEAAEQEKADLRTELVHLKAQHGSNRP